MRNKIILLMLLSIITAFSYQESYEVLAHFEEIDVTFDACVPLDYEHGNDGINEKWYNIFSNSKTDHISYQQGTIPTIRYYVSPSVINDYDNNQIDNATWSTNTTLAQGQLIKESYVNSMKKWDNIYYYKTEGSIVTKTKLVNFIEVSNTSYNLIIFPYYDNRIGVNVNTAEKSYDGTEVEIGNFNGATHIHYSLGRIGVNIHVNKDCQPGDMYLERTGAHEFGHILGLEDIDGNEKSATINYHHSELLMGYEEPRQTEITYKDLAGALVAMGFHTADDHKWMYSLSSTSGYKLICSICNGVKYSNTIPNGSVLFNKCNGNHTLSSDKMMPVASYGNKDYIKCKYCRYVASYENMVEQNYSEPIIDSKGHTYVNNVTGLAYTFFEPHNYTCSNIVPENIIHEFRCVECNYSYQENHKNFVYILSITPGKHRKVCEDCNFGIDEGHAVTYEDYSDGNSVVTCIVCNIQLDKDDDMFMVNYTNPAQTTINGSYILPNGIVVLKEEDILAYKEGALVFNDANSEIM